MSKYDINFMKVIEYNTPPVKQSGTAFLAYLNCLIQPLQDKHDEIFYNYYPDLLQRLNYNSQTIVFEAVLNKIFGVTSAPFIYINNTSNSISPIFFPKEVEGYNGVYFGKESEEEPIYFAKESEIKQTYDFIVNVPIAYTASDLQIRATVKKYKVAGKKFTVIYY
jgi:hypothetical protein